MRTFVGAQTRRVRFGAALALALTGVLLALLVPAGGALELPAGEAVPTVSASEGSARWDAVGAEGSYRVAISDAPRATAGRTTRYVTVQRAAGQAQSYRPEGPRGAVRWVGVSADGGADWSTTEARIVLHAASPGPKPPAPQAPASEAPGAEAPGAAAPSAPESPETPEAPGPGALPGEPPSLFGALEESLGLPRMIIGANGASGWGAEAAQTILGGHITWDRFSVKVWAPAVKTSLGYGFNVLGIVGNINDSSPLSSVEPAAYANQVVSELATHPGIALAEAGNEVYYKAGVANPAQYGRLYLAAVNALKANRIHIPLLFNMVGDFPYGSWASPKGWSEDARGGGWLREAVRAVPGLASAILENGISIHPYGALAENSHDIWGVRAAAADERVAQTVLGAVPPFYITEFGYNLAACGSDIGACSRVEQAAKLRAAYEAFELDPHISGIWWYSSHDDSTGRFGFLNLNNTKRPAFRPLSYFARLAGQ